MDLLILLSQAFKGFQSTPKYIGLHAIWSFICMVKYLRLLYYDRYGKRFKRLKDVPYVFKL